MKHVIASLPFVSGGKIRSYDTITQTNHGFTPGIVVALIGGVFERASRLSNVVKVGFVEGVNGDSFKVVWEGRVSNSNGDWTPGTEYGLSDTPGVLSETFPEDFSPILHAISSSEGMFTPESLNTQHAHEGTKTKRVDGALQYNKAICDVNFSIDPHNTLMGVILDKGSIFGTSDGLYVLELSERVRCNFSVVGLGGREETDSLPDLPDGYRTVWVVYNPLTKDVQLYCTLTEDYTPIEGYTSYRKLGYFWYDPSVKRIIFLYMIGAKSQVGEYIWSTRSYNPPSGEVLRSTDLNPKVEKYPTLYVNLNNTYTEIPTTDIWRAVTYQEVDSSLAYLFWEQRTSTEIRLHLWSVNSQTKEVLLKKELTQQWDLKFRANGSVVDPNNSDKIYYAMQNTDYTEAPYLRAVEFSTSTQVLDVRYSFTVAIEAESAGFYHNGTHLVEVFANKSNAGLYRHYINPDTGVRSLLQASSTSDPGAEWHPTFLSPSTSYDCLLWQHDETTANKSIWLFDTNFERVITGVGPLHLDLAYFRAVSAVYEEGTDLFRLVLWSEETFEVVFVNIKASTGTLLDDVQQLSEIPNGGVFALPQTQGRALVSAGEGEGLTRRLLGEMLGVEEHLLSDGEMPSHDGHASAWGLAATGTYSVAAGSNTSYGGDQPHQNMQPSLVAGLMIYAGKPLTE